MNRRILTYSILLAGTLWPISAAAKDGPGQKTGPQSNQQRMVLSDLNLSGLPAANPAETALAFLESKLNDSGTATSKSEFHVQEVQSVPGGTHVRMVQKIDGYRLYGHETVVSLNDRNEISMVLGTIRASASGRNPRPALTVETAEAIALGHLNIRGEVIEEVADTEPYLYETPDGSDHLAYKINIVCSDPMGDWELMIDAVTGEVLLMEDRFAQQGFVQGRGYAYLPDPVSRGRSEYGNDGYSDNDDRDSDELSAQRSLVTLDSVRYENGVYSLRGPYCTVADVEAPHYSEDWTATTPDGFRFSRSEGGFEAVNAFHHVSASYRYLETLGFQIPSLLQIRIDPHAYNGEDNSHYSPTGNWIGFGEGGVDDAEDAEVIWHEYGHAIQYRIVPSWGGGETRALGEGFGDYWAASYTRSLGSWSAADREFLWLYKWDGHNSFWDGRILDEHGTYPFTGLTSHEAGQIWAAALMGIWGELGKGITDRLVIKSQFYLGYGTTATEAALAILQADRDLYGGEHIPVLAHWLGTVKHFIDPSAQIPVIDHEPTSFAPEQAGPFRITALISAAHGIQTNSAMLCWQREGDLPDTTVMVNIPGTDEFAAEIADDRSGRSIHYYIVATDLQGMTTALPYGAPESFFAITFSNVEEDGDLVPADFLLRQNYPNPFNPTTTIEFSVPADGAVRLTVYNMLGRQVATLVDGPLIAGSHAVTWDGKADSGSRVASGSYIYRLTAVSGATGEFRSETRKMILMK